MTSLVLPLSINSI